MAVANLCRSCGIDFGSVRAFDTHRVGKHAYLYDADHPDGRRCLSLDEMLHPEDGDAAFARNEQGRLTLADGLARGRSFSWRTPARNRGNCV